MYFWRSLNIIKEANGMEQKGGSQSLLVFKPDSGFKFWCIKPRGIRGSKIPLEILVY